MSEIKYQMSKNKFSIKGSFPLNTIRDGEYFVVTCPVLDNLSRYEISDDEALKAFNEALVGTFMILNEENKLEEFLISCG